MGALFYSTLGDKCVCLSCLLDVGMFERYEPNHFIKVLCCVRDSGQFPAVTFDQSGLSCSACIFWLLLHRLPNIDKSLDESL